MSDQIPIKEYHADTRRVTSSMLKALNQSPRYYEAKYITKTIPSVSSPSMLIGSAVHCLALEPDEFDKRYVVCPFSNRRTKAYKEWASEEKRDVLTGVEMGKVRKAANALFTHPFIKAVLEAPGKVEHTLEWDCPNTNLPCKARPDKLSGSVVLDIKTTQNCSRTSFERSVSDYGYYLQQEHYLRGAYACEGSEDPMFMFAVVETLPPFRVRAMRLDAESEGIGHEAYDRLIAELAERMRDDNWSDPEEKELIDISLPKWEKNQWKSKFLSNNN